MINRCPSYSDTPQKSYSYDAFGNITSQSGSTPNNYTFSGKELDETGLYYFAARYYDATLGRFTSEDPVAADLIDPQTIDAFVYCLNNPMLLVDPWGRISLDLGDSSGSSALGKLFAGRTKCDKVAVGLMLGGACLMAGGMLIWASPLGLVEGVGIGSLVAAAVGLVAFAVGLVLHVVNAIVENVPGRGTKSSGKEDNSQEPTPTPHRWL